MYRKSIHGDKNEQNEELSQNRMVVEGGWAALVLVIFLCILATAAIVLMAIIHLDLLEALVVASFIGGFIDGWVVLVALTIRHVSATRTAVAVDETVRTRALFEQNVIYASENYILYRDPTDGSSQFRGTVHVDEHRQFLPKELSTPTPSETILTLYDQGMHGRSIEKWFKAHDKKVPYREIATTPDLYRPDWNKTYTPNMDPPTETLQQS